ncbi:hypothetical protein Tco_1235112 [Tanacetum coccineum]
MPERPRTQRRLEKGEKKNTGNVLRNGKKYKCSKCQEFGHNKSTCDRPNQVKESSHVPKRNKRQLFGPKTSVIPITVATNETASQPQQVTNQSVRGKKRTQTHARSAPKRSRTENFGICSNLNTRTQATSQCSNSTSRRNDQPTMIPAKVASYSSLTTGATFRQKLPTKRQ